MANSSNLITTAKGHELIVRILAGEIQTESQTPFTRIIASSAVHQMSELKGLTTIDQIQQETLISSVTCRNQTAVEIRGGMDNSNLQVGYRLNTVGVYFRNPMDNNEYLFGTDIHKSTPEEPPANFIFPYQRINNYRAVIRPFSKCG